MRNLFFHRYLVILVSEGIFGELVFFSRSISKSFYGENIRQSDSVPFIDYQETAEL